MQELGDKMKMTVSRAELTGILKDLAVRLEEKSVAEDGAESSLLDFKSLEITVKKKDEGYKFKLKIKRVKPAAPAETGAEEPVPDEAAGDDGEEDGGGDELDVDELYEELKKSMKKSWHAITKSADQNQLPPEEALGGFLRDCASMVTFKGFGDEFYPEFTEAAAALDDAFAAQDTAAFQAAVARMKERMESCHKKFKK